METKPQVQEMKIERWFAGIRGLHSHDDKSTTRIGLALGVEPEHIKIFYHNEYAAIKKFCKDHPGCYIAGYSAGAASGAMVIKQLMQEKAVLPSRADLYAPYGPSIPYFQGLPKFVNIWPDASSGQIPATGEGAKIAGNHFEIPKKLATILEERAKLADNVGNPEYDQYKAKESDLL